MKTPIADTPAPGPGELYDTLEGIVTSLARLEAAQGMPGEGQALRDMLARLEVTLAKLVRQEQKDKDLGMLMADCRDVMTEGIGVIHTQGTDVLAMLDRLLQGAATSTVTPPRWRAWQLWVSGACAGLVLCGAGWWLWPSSPSRYEAFAGALDGVLAQQYSTLPKATQDALAVVYGQWQFQPPAQRAKGAK